MLTGKHSLPAFFKKERNSYMLKISDVCVRRPARTLHSLRSLIRRYQQPALLRKFRSEMFDTEVAYAAKRSVGGEMYKIVNDAGAFFDVVSGENVGA